MKVVAWRTYAGVRRLTASARVLPDFLIIGGQKCGTTSLHVYLARHPLVMRSFGKEIHYFDHHSDAGAAWYRSHFATRAYGAALGRVHRARAVTGEASPFYLAHPQAPRRAAALLPAARLIALVRNPVDRAYSHYQHNVRRGREHIQFAEALDHEQERLAGEEARLASDPHYHSPAFQHFSYMRRGDYANQLTRWLEHYATEQLLILDSDTFFADPAPIVQRTLSFLGLPPFEGGIDGPHNAARYAPMETATRQRLIDHFRAPNAALREMTGMTLDWDR